MYRALYSKPSFPDWGLKSLLKFQPQARSSTYLVRASADLYQHRIFHRLEKTVEKGTKNLRRHSPLLCSPCEHRSTSPGGNLFGQRHFAELTFHLEEGWISVLLITLTALSVQMKLFCVYNTTLETKTSYSLSRCVSILLHLRLQL